MITNGYDYRKISGRRSSKERRVSFDPNYKGLERRIAKRRTKSDNRKHIRYRVKDHVYVGLRSETEEEVGQILDISKGGLSLHYPEAFEKKREYTDLGIFSNMELAVERIAFRSVSDIKLAGGPKLNGPNLRRRSLQFENLTPEQEIKLDYFISNYTLGRA
jgi:hypothetical protein